jgi:hypothetical protein
VALKLDNIFAGVGMRRLEGKNDSSVD